MKARSLKAAELDRREKSIEDVQQTRCNGDFHLTLEALLSGAPRSSVRMRVPVYPAIDTSAPGVVGSPAGATGRQVIIPRRLIDDPLLPKELTRRRC